MTGLQELKQTLINHASIDPHQNILGNIRSNLNDALERMSAKRQHADAAARLQRAIDEQNQRQANRLLWRKLRWKEAAAPVMTPQKEDQAEQELWQKYLPKNQIMTPLREAEEERQAWERVTKDVPCYFERLSGEVAKMASAPAPVAFDLETEQFCVVGESAKLKEKVAAVGGRVIDNTEPNLNSLVWIKLARPLQWWAAAQKPFGGPTPLTAAILNGLLGAGVGYGGGYLAEKLLPKKHFRPGRLSKVLALAGAAAGSAAPLWWGTLKYHADPLNPGKTFADRGAGWMSRYPFRPEDYHESEALAGLDIPQDAALRKKGSDRTGALFAPTIPVDAFNQAVWNDVTQAPNPWGTKSPWSDNAQPLHTPAPVAAAASGLVAGAAAARNGASHVSIWDVAKAGAIGGGQGLLAGLVGGKVIGALTGLQPKAQKKVWQLGAAGGALTKAMQIVFGGD